MKKIILVLVMLSACVETTDDNFSPSPPATPPATCTEIPELTGCGGGSVAYSCSSDRPDDGDLNLVCSVGTPGALGATLYCCAPYGTYYSECTVDTTIAGCVGNSMGFSCSGETSPSQADGALACGPAINGANDELQYCCSSSEIVATCAVDPTITSCQSNLAVGISCAGTELPYANDPSIACAAAAGGGAGTSSYCCQL